MDGRDLKFHTPEILSMITTVQVHLEQSIPRNGNNVHSRLRGAIISSRRSSRYTTQGSTHVNNDDS